MLPTVCGKYQMLNKHQLVFESLAFGFWAFCNFPLDALQPVEPITFGAENGQHVPSCLVDRAAGGVLGPQAA